MPYFKNNMDEPKMQDKHLGPSKTTDTKDNIMNESKKQHKDYDISVNKIKGFRPPAWHVGKWREAGDFLTFDYLSDKMETHVKRIDATHYKNLRTGEIMKYSVWSEEDRNKVRRSTLKRTFEELKACIRANFGSDKYNQLFITLTYRDNMTDTKRLYKDFKNFIDRLKYAYKEHDFEYIAVMEPHGSGVWHVHLMLKSVNQKVLYIPDKEIRLLWRQGITDTQRLKSDDVGRYYCAYFTGMIADTEYTSSELEDTDLENTSEDIFLTEQCELQHRLNDEDGVKAGYLLPKKYIKGQRLKFYPKHFKFYRCSDAIVRPKKIEAIFGVPEAEHLNLECELAYKIVRTYNQDCIETKKDGAVVIRKKGDEISINTIYKSTYRKKEGYADQRAAHEKYKEYQWENNQVIQAKKRLEEQAFEQTVMLENKNAWVQYDE